ncbi:MAG: transglycosylase SLT domain-containing protein [Candidatus Limnocylindria bacterium]
MTDSRTPVPGRWTRCASIALAGFLLAACGGGLAPGVPVGASPSAVTTPTATAEPVATVEPQPTEPQRTATPEPEMPRWDETPVVAEEPGALAEQIAAAERAIRDPAVIGAELAWMAHLQQLAYRRLVMRPDWREAVLAALPDGVRAVAVANLDAGADLRALVTPRDGLPDWRIVEPAPADELLGYYREAEAEFGVPWPYLAAIHLVETRMGRIRGTSVAGAQGPMQFMPATWAAYGEGDVNDDRDAIRAAARYLRASGAPGDMARALFSYNRSQRYVRAVTAYAEIMRAEPDAYRGYYHWQVYYLTTGGDVLLPVGYGSD